MAECTASGVPREAFQPGGLAVFPKFLSNRQLVHQTSWGLPREPEEGRWGPRVGFGRSQVPRRPPCRPPQAPEIGMPPPAFLPQPKQYRLG